MRRNEESERDMLPVWLHDAEIENPKQVFDDFYETHSLPVSRLYLWEMYHATVINFDDLRCDCSPVNMLTFTSQLMCLLEAVDLVRQSGIYKIKEHTSFLDVLRYIPEWVREEENLLRAINIICATMDAEKIFLLGRFPGGSSDTGVEYSFLVFLENTTGKNLKMTAFQKAAKDKVKATITIMQTSAANRILKENNTFFSLLCNPAYLVCDAKRAELYKAPDLRPDIQLEAIYKEHDLLKRQAAGFLNIARNATHLYDYNFNLFILHQATEFFLKALLQPLLKEFTKTHNIISLFRYVRRFNSDICHVCGNNSGTTADRFEVLQRAYRQTRFKNNYTAPAGDTKEVLDFVALLEQKVDVIFGSILETCFRELER